MRWMWRLIQQITMRICGFVVHTTLVHKPLPWTETLISRNAIEVSEIFQVYISLVKWSGILMDRLGHKRSIKITDHFNCTSANVIYCITCTLCKKLYIGETGRRLDDRFREHLPDVEKDDKNASKPVARYFRPVSNAAPFMRRPYWRVKHDRRAALGSAD